MKLVSSTNKYAALDLSSIDNGYNNAGTIDHNSNSRDYSEIKKPLFVQTLLPKTRTTTKARLISTTNVKNPSQSVYYHHHDLFPFLNYPTTPSLVSSDFRSIAPSTTSGKNISEDNNGRSTFLLSEAVSTPVSSAESIYVSLRSEGHFAIAKYLRQSGLDTVINKTGKY